MKRENLKTLRVWSHDLENIKDKLDSFIEDFEEILNEEEKRKWKKIII